MRIDRKLAIVIGAAAIAAGISVGVGVAGAAGPADDGETGDSALTGAVLQRASEAALAETGGGRVTATENEPDEGGYEVEVTLDDGSQVDVQVDSGFTVVTSSDDVGDSSGPDDDPGA